MNISQKNKEALKNPWVLGMLAFLVVFLSANAIFIYLAFSSPPNLVVEDFYERGKKYEETHKKAEEQKMLGWSGTLLLPSKSRVNQLQMYEVLIQGQNSSSLQLDSVSLNAYRPSDARADFTLDMVKVSPGVYRVDASFDLPGIWDIIIVAKQTDQEFLITKRITIQP
jgi:nitrogen fixation protein FixH